MLVLLDQWGGLLKKNAFYFTSKAFIILDILTFSLVSLLTGELEENRT